MAAWRRLLENYASRAFAVLSIVGLTLPSFGFVRTQSWDGVCVQTCAYSGLNVFRNLQPNPRSDGPGDCGRRLTMYQGDPPDMFTAGGRFARLIYFAALAGALHALFVAKRGGATLVAGLAGLAGLAAAGTFSVGFLGGWWLHQEHPLSEPLLGITLGPGAYLALAGFLGIAACSALASRRTRPAPPIADVFR